MIRSDKTLNFVRHMYVSHEDFCTIRGRTCAGCRFFNIQRRLTVNGYPKLEESHESHIFRLNYLGVSQGVLETTLSRRFQTYVPVVAAGRTDTGVHAIGQAVHFDLPSASVDLEHLTYVMNQMMPEVSEAVPRSTRRGVYDAGSNHDMERDHLRTVGHARARE